MPPNRRTTFPPSAHIRMALLVGALLAAPAGAQEWSDLLRPFASRSADKQRDETVCPTVVVRVSQTGLQKMFDREIARDTEVDEIVLGARVRGKSRVEGVLTIDLVPDGDSVSFQAVLAGTAVSRTAGRKGPAVIHSRAVTEFVAKKRVAFEADSGFRAASAKIEARTRLINEGICSTLPGIRGRIVRRIACRRAAACRGQAKAIARRNAARRIAAAFNERVDAALTRLNERLLVQRTVGNKIVVSIVAKCQVCTTDRGLQICWRRDGFAEQSPDLPREKVRSSDVEVWLHDSLAGDGADSLRSWARLRDLPRQLLRPEAPVRPAIDVELFRLPRIAVTPVEDWLVIQIAPDEQGKPRTAGMPPPPARR